MRRIGALVSKFWRLDQIYIWIMMILTVSCLGRYKIAFCKFDNFYFSAVSSLQFDFRHLQHMICRASTVDEFSILDL